MFTNMITVHFKYTLDNHPSQAQIINYLLRIVKISFFKKEGAINSLLIF